MRIPGDLPADEPAYEVDGAESAARARVLARLRDAAPHTESPLRTSSVHTTRPMRRPPTALVVKQAARSRAGLTHDGAYPGAGLWSSVVLPSGVLAVVDLGIGAVAELATGGALGLMLTVTWLVAFVVLGGVCAGAGRRVVQDPLRLSATERRMLEATRHWESSQAWSAATSAGQERRLVSVACDLTKRITASRSWAAGFLDDQRLRLDLGAELDQIDAQAHRLAAAREAAGGAEPSGTAWNALVDRVVALDRYAAELAALDGRLVESSTATAVTRVDAVPELAAGTVRDRYATDDLRALATELRAITDEPG